MTQSIYFRLVVDLRIGYFMYTANCCCYLARDTRPTIFV